MKRAIAGLPGRKRRFPFKVGLSKTYLRKTVLGALREDVAKGDLTTSLTVGSGSQARAALLLKQDGVVAGLDVFKEVFRVFDPSVRMRTRPRSEGRWLEAGTVLAEVRGPTRSLLTCERVALNFIQHLSGIATTTRRFVERVKGTGASILDTRKTIPGLRLLEKYAVSAGGGFSHRPTLSDLVLIKDNHISAAGGIDEAVLRARRARPGVLLEVEVGPHVDVRSLEGLEIDLLMFDNWKPAALKQAIGKVRRFPTKPLVEVSGRVRLENVREFALAGPDFISVGSLTHSAPALDISLKLESDAET